MGAGVVAGNAEAESCAAGGSVARRLDAIKRFEDLVDLALRYARPVVADGDAERLPAVCSPPRTPRFPLATPLSRLIKSMLAVLMPGIRGRTPSCPTTEMSAKFNTNARIPLSPHQTELMGVSPQAHRTQQDGVLETRTRLPLHRLLIVHHVFHEDPSTCCCPT